MDLILEVWREHDALRYEPAETALVQLNAHGRVAEYWYSSIAQKKKKKREHE